MKDYLNVSEIGRLFGLGIQTIHYYDKIGILKPAFREGKAVSFRKLTNLYTIQIHMLHLQLCDTDPDAL